jgi:simple sugar transport system permease protein
MSAHNEQNSSPKWPMLSRFFVSHEWKIAILAPVMSILIALLVGNLLIIISGESPAKIFYTLLAGTWGNAYGLGQVLYKATPLIFTGLAVAIPFRAGLFNIGAEGQATLGALAGGLVGAYLPAGTPWLLGVPLTASIAFFAGASWGCIPGYFKGRFGAHEVITTIMMNFIALAFANYLVVRHFGVRETLHTAPLLEAARLSRIGDFIPAFHGSAVSTALLWAMIAALVCWWLLFRTTLGFEIRAVGLNAPAAECSGISTKKITTLSMALGGGCAGLVSMSFVQGYKYYFEVDFMGGMGFMGIAVALLGRNHPVGIVLAALLFSTLSQGGLVINAMVPKEIVNILQAVIILSVVAASSEVRAILIREGKS